jgi:radical SAM superfamily enzyme YgiQ (UPF0313 family)
MADLLLTHSYFLRLDPKEQEAMMPYPPLGTLIAAAELRSRGHSVALFDSMLAVGPADIVPHLERHRPKVVAIYDDDFNYLTKMCLGRMREAAFAMTRTARSMGSTVVIHGSDAVDHLDAYFAHGADYVICGEGEQTLGELAAFLLEGTGSPETIAGLARRSGEGYLRNPDRPVLKDLDALPFAAWDLVDVERYRSVWKERHGYYSVNLVTTRGCPYHCNWCAKPIYGQVYNSRSPAGVVREMKRMKETLRPDHLWFCDDIFGLKPGWVQAFAAEVVREDAVIPFKCLSRVDLLLKEDAVENLKKAGCRTVWVGAESGSQKILDAMEKGTTVEQIVRASAALREAGIRYGFFLQYGYPGETREDIEATLQMVRTCRPDEIGVSVSYPLPGTPFHERVRSQMTSQTNWVDSADLAMMFAGTYSTEFYRVLHRVTHKKFRIWQAGDILRAALRRPASLSPAGVRRLAASVYHALTLPGLQSHMDRLAVPRAEGPAPVSLG